MAENSWTPYPRLDPFRENGQERVKLDQSQHVISYQTLNLSCPANQPSPGPRRYILRAVEPEDGPRLQACSCCSCCSCSNCRCHCRIFFRVNGLARVGATGSVPWKARPATYQPPPPSHPTPWLIYPSASFKLLRHPHNITRTLARAFCYLLQSNRNQLHPGRR